MAASKVVTKAPSFIFGLKKWAYNLSGFNKYGLYLDDILDENDDVLEALKRVPKNVIDERNYRNLRAVQLSIQKIVLPKEQWTTFEDDLKNRYLSPIVEQVKKEREEQESWNSKF